MTFRVQRTITILILVLFSLAFGSAWAQNKKGTATTVQTGIVVSAEQVKLESAAGKGALIGGIAGYASQGGRSGKKKRKYGALGAATGAAIGGATTGGRGMAYTVQTAGGSVRVVTDQTEVRIGDCVTVEQAGKGTANLRRMSPSACETPVASLPADLQEEFHEEAEECLAAKEELLDAETDDAVQRAVTKVNILCND
ncbi:MAG: hypothetical protein OEU36_06880 [Gammaproteobacteria bacterium]|nr:hypothetical protein [Gammaproteobacteria bacterium]